MRKVILVSDMGYKPASEIKSLRRIAADAPSLVMVGCVFRFSRKAKKS